MVSKSLSGPVLLILMLIAGRGLADEIRGTVKSVDLENSTITMDVGAADQVYPVAADARFFGQFGKKTKKATTRAIPGGLKGVEAGSEVVVTTEKRDAADVISQVKVEGLQAKEKKRKKKDA